MPIPEVSVVVPSSGRETRLAFLLDSLAEQTLDRDRFEVIVVRESDTGLTTSAPPGLEVTFLERPAGAGIGAARDIGWRAARAERIAFTDNDCRAHPEWLETLLAAARDPDTIVQGRTEPDPDERQLHSGLARTQQITGPSPWYETCNMAYHRSVLERVGGFDPSFRVMAEDTDLALRAIDQGARRIYCEDALVWHAVHVRLLPDALREAARWGEILPLVKRHPVMRREAFYNWLFWKESHAKLALGLIGSALVGRRNVLLAAAAWAPYVAYRLDQGPRRPGAIARRSLEIPTRLALDLTEVAVIARAAIRHRTPVL